MTCIIAIKDKKNNLWFGSDRRVTSGFNIIPSDEPKTKFKDNIIVAGAGTAWICDLILERYTFPELEDDDTSRFYAHNILIPDLIRWLRNEGFVDKTGMRLNTGANKVRRDEVEEDCGILLIGIRSSLFELTISESEISILKVGSPYAIGCGGSFALGAIHATEGSGMKVITRLVLACKIAAKCSAGCGDRIDVLTNKGLF